MSHPIEYVKILMQLGHEPLPIQDTTTLFGSPARIRPNIFQYLAYIYRTDGIRGCFRGLSAHLAGLLLSLKLSPILIAQGTKFAGIPEIMTAPNLNTDDEAKFEDYYKKIRRDIIVHVATMIVAYPFYVISMRMMAAFIGNDEGYLSLSAAIVSTIKENSVLGFYNGFIPRVLSDTYCMVTSSILGYYINKYVLKTKELRKWTEPLVCAAVIPAFYLLPYYPLMMTSTCMAVSGSSLKAGNPPLMPVYVSWIHCIVDLYKTSQHTRGAAAFFRYVDDNK